MLVVIELLPMSMDYVNLLSSDINRVTLGHLLHRFGSDFIANWLLLHVVFFIRFQVEHATVATRSCISLCSLDFWSSCGLLYLPGYLG